MEGHWVGAACQRGSCKMPWFNGLSVLRERDCGKRLRIRRESGSIVRGVEAGDDGAEAGGVGRGGLVAQQESMVGADGQSAACGDQG